MRRALLSKPNDRLKSLSTEELIYNFRKIIFHSRISIHEGSEVLQISRGTVLKDSLKGVMKLNLNKELKISFKGEMASDAGGLSKEWVREVFEGAKDELLSEVNADGEY
jgi:hypothetical protein